MGRWRLNAVELLRERYGRTILLTLKVFDLLPELLERAGRLGEKEELFRAVRPETIVEESNLSSTIANCRLALGDGEGGAFFRDGAEAGLSFCG